MLVFRITGQKIDLERREVVADEQVAFVNLLFLFTPEWEQIDKVAQFKQGENVYNVHIGKGNVAQCTLPSEITNGQTSISIFGYHDEVRATTATLEFRVCRSGFSDSGSVPIPPTPDLYAQLLKKIDGKIASLHDGKDGKDGENGKSAYEIAVQNGYDGTETDWLESLKGQKGDTGEPGADGAKGDPGEKGDHGEPGEKGERGEKGEKGDAGTPGKDGVNGKDGTNGVDGKNGTDGYSPTATVTKTDAGAVISITDKNGTTTATVKNGVGEKTAEYGEIFNTYSGEYANKATGNHSHAEGHGTTASGDYSHAEGYNTQASNTCSHAEGSDCIASEGFSHAEGYSTQASGSCSHSEGYQTIASGGHSHAEGWKTEASGEEAHAEGSDCIASGLWSHAEGRNTKASGEEAHAEGECTIAAGSCQHASGKYNLEDVDNKYAFIIGNGKVDAEKKELIRSNAFAIDWNGKIYVNNSTDGVDVSDVYYNMNELQSRFDDTCSAKTVYVDAVNGSDTQDGTTQAKALQTLSMALQLTQYARKAVIYLAAGTYTVPDKTLTLLGRDVRIYGDTAATTILQGNLVCENSFLLMRRVTIDSTDSTTANQTANTITLQYRAAIRMVDCTINTAGKNAINITEMSNANFVGTTFRGASQYAVYVRGLSDAKIYTCTDETTKGVHAGGGSIVYINNATGASFPYTNDSNEMIFVNGQQVLPQLSRKTIQFRHGKGTLTATATGTNITWQYGGQQVQGGSCTFDVKSDNGLIKLECDTIESFTITNDTTNKMDLSDLGGKITSTLRLSNCSNITGDLSDLGGKITNWLSLNGCSKITGDLSDLGGKITNWLNLSNCSKITGDLSDLGGKIAGTINLNGCSNITGVYSGAKYPKAFSVARTSITSADMDANLINFAASGVKSGKFTATGMKRTSASDDAVATLVANGWTVSGLTKEG